MIAGRYGPGSWSIGTVEEMFDDDGYLREPEEKDFWQNGGGLSGPGYRYEPESNTIYVG